MMHFLHPIWFTALAALGIPVVIHLWNIRPGKTLKVGSISIFQEASPASSRSFKLLDILLLILRCALLVFIAALLAAPFWYQKSNESAKGWLLIPRGYLNEAYKRYHGKIDSLTKSGYEFHYFDNGFPKENLNEVLKEKAVAATVDDSVNYWLLAASADKKLPPNVKAELFTPNTATHFRGEQIAVNHPVKWNTFTAADSVITWLSHAWITDNGSIRVAQGTAKPSGVNYQYTEIRNGDNNTLYNVTVDNGRTSVHLKTTDSIQTAVDNQVAILAIYAGNNEADANYLRAGLEAASRFMLKRVQIKVYHQSEAIPADADWLFWLSDSPVQAKNAKHVLYYAGGETENINSWLSKNDNEHPQLFKSITANKTTGQPLWTDATGIAMLGKYQLANTELYPFYTRFNPTWSDLVWSDAFPNWLLQLLTPETTITAKNDVRSIDKAQIEPQIGSSQASFVTQADNSDLSHYLWYIIAILFFAERWLAHQTKTNNG
jgi:hypothetical protein